MSTVCRELRKSAKTFSPPGGLIDNWESFEKKIESLKPLLVPSCSAVIPPKGTVAFKLNTVETFLSIVGEKSENYKSNI